MKVTKLPAKPNADCMFTHLPAGAVFQKYKKAPVGTYAAHALPVLNRQTYYMKMRMPNGNSDYCNEKSNTVSLDQASKSYTHPEDKVRMYIKEELIIQEIEE